jgi:serine/threonine protein kinase
MAHDLAHVWDCEVAPEPLFRTGEVISDAYVIRGLIAVGGMGEVYAADDLALRRAVAIKTMSPTGPNAGGALLRREAQALAQLHHPALVTVHGLGTHRGLPYLVMERLFGLSLAELIASRAREGSGGLAVSEVVDILVRIAEGLAVVHDAGMAHHDLKPGNVMVCAGGRTVILDLGIMVPRCGDHGTRDVAHAGTPMYMAPELLGGSIEPDLAPLADVYAFGALAHELLAGTPPWGDEAESLAILARQYAAEPPDLRRVRSDVPHRLAGLVRDCLARDPSDRPSCMEQVAWELRASADVRRARRLTI